jgi:hypothetical protein
MCWLADLTPSPSVWWCRLQLQSLIYSHYRMPYIPSLVLKLLNSTKPEMLKYKHT